ncbi:hypothetical protein A3A39_01305 [Candidatus Kaiserbacteria bacterium RIFCSPLOWO2_01_FULL_54_13]|uniref:Uncharacterized protein n=1 Tax=Candidatus Kaiserbacteria bacterium RIFCSPLOWO2_01_FULL_54_13 TaxID=1798512 RepID=A0A1F6F2C1_9BACT|nr:MAG: hypothetical protein A3A39_01305 [Candidatus Kaiserbacteria bacterium RIFCSPLOWO2_01_FULL_54_13]
MIRSIAEIGGKDTPAAGATPARLSMPFPAVVDDIALVTFVAPEIPGTLSTATTVDNRGWDPIPAIEPGRAAIDAPFARAHIGAAYAAFCLGWAARPVSLVEKILESYEASVFIDDRAA